MLSLLRLLHPLRCAVQDVELVQFMGKDNVPFHTVIFPATQARACACLFLSTAKQA